MIRLTIFALLFVLYPTVGQTGANLAGCEARTSPAHRQIVAIRRLEKQRQCAQRSLKGIFNGCKDLANKRKALEREFGATGYSACKRSQQIKSVPLAKTRKKQPMEFGVKSGLVLYCVRPSDGYYFPTPHSQFLESADIHRAAEQCQVICQDQSMVLYRLPIAEVETDNLISLDGKSYYRDLPSAFRYRSASDFQSCDHKRYYERVAEFRARTVTPTNLSNAVIPLPSFRPGVETAVNDRMADGGTTFDEAPSAISYEQTSSIPKARVIDFARPAGP